MVEMMATVLIFLIIIGGLVLVLNMSYLPDSITRTKLELQPEVRRAMQMMTRDLRQTSRMKLGVINATGVAMQFAELTDNTTFSSPAFNLCTGYNQTAEAISWSDTNIGYAFNATTNRVTRTDYATNQELHFNNIQSIVFTKTDTNELEINITAQKVARGAIAPAVSLETGVKLRNE